jgi:hypothetical protein
MITTSPLLRVKSHCIPFTKCVVYKGTTRLGVRPGVGWKGSEWIGTQCPETRLGVPTAKVSIGARKLQVYEKQGDVIAEWLPQQTGMYPQGYGNTVLEAIGDLCIWEGVVEIGEPCEVVDRRWSIAQSAPDRR